MRGSLVGRLLAIQLLVVAVAGLTLVVTAALVGPGLFTDHLRHIGEDSPMVIEHAEQAFVYAFAISLGVAMIVALLTAGLLAALVVRRIAGSVTDLADAADAIAEGRLDVVVPVDGFSTELTRLSAAFSRMATRLAATEATRSGMLADLSHELRTPLATLEAYIDGLEDGIVAPEAASYQVMRDQVLRLRRLAVDVRAVSAAEEHALDLRPVPCDPTDLAADAVRFANPAYQAKGVDLAVAAARHLPHVLADPERVGQVLGNLLANALRHTPPGGHVTVTVTVTAATGQVEFVVADDGEGIPADQLEAVFDRFHRIDPARVAGDGSGSGLGLTIARAIAAGHGGTLTAASPGAGGGASFRLGLPAC